MALSWQRCSRRAELDTLICLALAAVTLALFWPATGFEFNNYDDSQYVTSNPHVLSGLSWKNVAWAFTSGYASNWHPLTWLSHMLDCQIYGVDAGGHHLTNILFHTANVLLLYALWRCLTGAVWRSALVAALFGWHPMHVESVAFIAERKDVLSAFFGFATLLAYWHYARQPSGRRYALVILGFVLGLMCKPMLVSLSLLMLLLDFWPLERRQPWGRLVVEKVPLLALSAASSAVTIWAQRAGGAMATLQAYPFSTRLLNAIHAYVAYIGKLLWPAHLAVLYPYRFHLAAGAVAGAAVLFIGLTIAALWGARGRRRPWWTVGWLWFVIALGPVIGIVQVGGAAMADRYSYIPSVGLFVLAAWEATAWLAGRLAGRWMLGVVSAVILAACLVGTSRQLSYWRNSVTLFSHALAVTPDNAVAECNLGSALESEGKTKEAREHLERALRLSPHYANAEDNLGLISYDQGDLPDAEKDFRAAVKDDPHHDRAWANLGLLLLNSGRASDAIDPLTHAVARSPENAYAQLGLARALDDAGKAAQAFPHYLAAVEDKPNLPEAQANLGAALTAQGRYPEALSHLQRALALNGHSWEAHYYMGNVLLAAGQNESAAQQYRQAALYRPENPYIQLNLAAALQRLGQTNDAIAAAERCLTLATNASDAGVVAQLKKQLAALRGKR